MKRMWGNGFGVTLVLLCLFLFRDIEQPDAVTGATRRAVRQPSAPQQALPPPQAPLAKPIVKPAPVPVPMDPGQIFVSASVPAPVLAVVPAPIPPARVLTPDVQGDKVSNRTFEGKVELIVDQGLGDGSKMVTMVSAFGERFKFIIDPATFIYDGEDHSFHTKPVVGGDKLFVRYVLKKENTAIEVKVE